jgi:hypothetical protein
VSCIITHKGKKYSEEQFKEYFINNKQEFTTSIAKNKDVMDSFKRKMEGIDFVFSQSPELASIGSKAQYLQYLSTIFKTSKVKDIVYHFSNTKIDKPDKEKFSLSANINRRKGFFGINKNVNPGNNFANVEGTIPHAMLFNMKNPDSGDFSVLPPIVAKDETRDSAIIKQRGNINYYVVFEPEQIHILSSKSDIEKFKEFISNNTQKTEDYFSNEINKIQKESKVIENFLKEYETSKKIDNRNTTKAIKNKEEKTKETNNKLLSLGFEFINENEYQFSTSSYITFKSKLNSLEGIDVSINTFKSPDYLIKIKIAPLKNNFDLQKQGELPFNPIELKLALKENDFIQDIADNTFEGLTEEQINILRDNLENGELNLNCKI